MSPDPNSDTPAQTLRSALWTYLMRTHNCHAGNPCYEDCSEFVSDAADDWLADVQRWGTSGPHVASDRRK